MRLPLSVLATSLLAAHGLWSRPLRPQRRALSTTNRFVRLHAVYQNDNPNPEDAGYYPIDEEDYLGALREEKQLDNDRWQSILLRDTHSGSFSGTYEAFVPGMRENGFGLMRKDYGRVEFHLRSEDMKPFGVKTTIVESFASEAPVVVDDIHLSKLFSARDLEILPADLRLTSGNQVIGNSFTIVQADNDTYIAEIGIREGPIRVRVKFGYSTQGIFQLLQCTYYYFVYLSIFIRQSRQIRYGSVCYSRD